MRKFSLFRASMASLPRITQIASHVANSYTKNWTILPAKNPRAVALIEERNRLKERLANSTKKDHILGIVAEGWTCGKYMTRPLFLSAVSGLLPSLFGLTVGCRRIGMVQIKIRDLQGERLGINVGAVGEHDDSQVVVGKALDVGAETYRLSIVRHALVTSIGIEKPSESVAQGLSLGSFGRTIGRTHGSQGGLHFRFARQRRVAKGAGP